MTAKPEDEPDEAAELAQRLPLLDAFIRWVDPKLTEGIRECEQWHTKRELLTYDKPVLSKPNELAVPTNTRWMAGPSDLSALSAAWRAAIRDFKRQVQDGELHLEGVEFTDDLSARPQAIPGTFAAKMILDFSGSALKLGRREFLSVTASRTPSAWAPIGAPGAIPSSAATLPLSISTLTDEQILDLLSEYVRRVTESSDPKIVARIKDVLQPISDRMTAEQVPDLDPEVVATLLEQHAEHVRTGLRVQLAEPGKASALALAASMLRHRARTNQLRPAMAEEAEWLSAWVTKVAPSYASLGTKRLQNALGHSIEASGMNIRPVPRL